MPGHGVGGAARDDGQRHAVLHGRAGDLLDRAVAARVDKVAVFTAASETFNRKNINTSTAGSIRRFRPVVKGAKGAGLTVRGYVSTAFWCAFEGQIAPEATVDLAERLVDMGVDEVSISDTIGKATPDEVARLLGYLQARPLPLGRDDSQGADRAGADAEAIRG